MHFFLKSVQKSFKIGIKMYVKFRQFFKFTHKYLEMPQLLPIEPYMFLRGVFMVHLTHLYIYGRSCGSKK